MNKKRITIRIDDRMKLIIDEIAVKNGVSPSCVVRSLLSDSIERILDKYGYIKCDGTK